MKQVGGTVRWLASSLVLLLLLARPIQAQDAQRPRPVKWADLPERLAQKNVPIENLNLADCPSAIRQQRPARSIAQIIETLFYLWEEYDLISSRGETTNVCVFMLKPELKPLTRQEAQTLLTASTLWKEQPPPSSRMAVRKPDDPRLTATPMPLPFASAADLVKPRARSVVSGVSHEAAPGEPVFGRAAPVRAKARSYVVGADDRTRVTNTGIYPYSTICFLSMEFAEGMYRGSGTLVSPYMVLTCGHVVFDKAAGAWAKHITITPGQRQYTDGGDVEEPWGSFNARWFSTSDAYTQGGNWAYDYGALHFEDAFWGVGTFTPVEFNSTFAADDVINMCGYPGEAQGASTYSQWYAPGNVVKIEDRLICHTMDSYGGSSGSSMYYYTPPSTRRIVGVHNFGSTDYNGGAYLCQENKDVIIEWMQWTPGRQGPPSRVTAALAAKPAKDEEQVPTFTVKAGESFTCTNRTDARAEIMIATNASPEGADIRLLYTPGRAGGTGSFACWYQGKWMPIGIPGAAEKTYGKMFKLDSASAADEGVLWNFDHHLKPGETFGLYEKQNDVWVLKARVVCPAAAPPAGP